MNARVPAVPALDTLCTQWGVAPAYDNDRGERLQAPPATLQRIVDVLRGTGSPAEAPVLPPVHVMQQGEHHPVAHRLPAGTAWRLTMEAGTVIDGEVTAEGHIVWPSALPLGYHHLTSPAHPDGMLLAVCPERCHTPPALARGDRWWGPTAQVYALRSARQWGFGDFTDLRHLVDLAAAQGAAFVGINPLHALFPHDPARASPYSPSSRTALNPLYLDVEAMVDFATCATARLAVADPGFQASVQRLRDAAHVDPPAVLAIKFPVLRLLFDHFRDTGRGTPREEAFRHFQREQAGWLGASARYDAWWSTHGTPPPAPDDPALLRFAEERATEIGFFEYLQWQCDVQLAAVADHARTLGMPMGLYRDLAVGVNQDGAETWARPALHAPGFSAGAPPESVNPSGQSWGLPPWIPTRLVDAGFAPFIELLRANMRHAGALRLDHAMALQRLFWVPHDADSRAGTYVDYPFEALLNLVALESARHHCVVIGEDLGTVPPGFREALSARGVLSYRPLYFAEDAHGGLPPPADWPADALAVVGTHDLPPWPAWWRGDDIALRHALGLYPDTAGRDAQVLVRARDRAKVLLALEHEHVLPEGASLAPDRFHGREAELADALHAFLGRTRSALVGVQLEDVVQQAEPVNVPGTRESERPNWRLKLDVSLDALATDPRWLAAGNVLRVARGAAGGRTPTAGPPLDSAVVPTATYRIQFHAGMRFEDATALVPYLDRLGVSHLYASPYLKARAGSTHGYDIVDHATLNPEIGTAADHDALCDTLRRHGMSQVLDIVPNHMGVLGSDNAWWHDVLECGQASRHAATFDIEWHAAPEWDGRVLLPVLGAPYGEVLESGQLGVSFDVAQGTLQLTYFEHRFPLDPASYPDVFAAAPPPEDADAGWPAVQSLLDALRHLPPHHTPDPEARCARQRDKPLLQRRLADLGARHPWLVRWADAGAKALQGDPGEACTFDRLHALVERQAYRLAFWRVAGDDVNYRRFFDISTLAAVRMEDPEVFEATHRTVFQWIGEGRISGLRIDHPDGLADPRAYLQSLQVRHEQALRERGLPARALFVAVEKILAEHEQIPSEWPVHGGTGYRFANQVNGLFVDGSNEAAFTTLYQRFTNQQADFDSLLHDSKHLVMSTSLASDLQWLTESLFHIAQSTRTTRDFTRGRLRQALRAVAAAFPVYRTYLDDGAVAPHDRQHLEWAVSEATSRSAASDVPAIAFLQAVLLGQSPASQGLRQPFVRRWQQFTAPVMAKSMEDTAFYRYHRLISLNDVGGDPRRFGMSVDAFHAANTTRSRHLPHTLLGTSTHDSKRSEDVRARLGVLSELPASWEAAIGRWAALNRPAAERRHQPVDPNDEYLIYQTIVGVWPMGPVDDTQLAVLRERVEASTLKAAREAKLHTSWLDPVDTYEAALRAFVEQLLGRRSPNPFLTDLTGWIEPVQRFGAWNSLNQVVFKLTSPGVPDVYQGCETWNFSLVDPDNRRPVDFAARQRDLDTVLGEVRPDNTVPRTALDTWLADLPSGRLKVFVTARLLALRRAHPALFRDGSYVPLHCEGPGAAHVVAWSREHQGTTLVVVGTRLLATFPSSSGEPPIGAPWQGTAVFGNGLPSTFVDTLTGQPVSIRDGRLLPLDEAFAFLPFAVLLSSP